MNSVGSNASLTHLQHQLSQDSKVAIQTSTKSDKQIMV